MLGNITLIFVINFGSTMTTNILFFNTFCQLSALVHLIIASILLCQLLFGTPIQCMVSGKEIPTALLNNYCLKQQTSYLFTQADEKDYTSINHWIPFIILLLSILSYTPKFLFDNLFENCQIKKIAHHVSN